MVVWFTVLVCGQRRTVMGRAYCQDLRDRVIAAVDGGAGAYAIAPLFQVSVSYIYKALGRRRATGETPRQLRLSPPIMKTL